MRTFELRKLENAPKSMRWMVMCNGKAYAGFSTKKVAKEAMETYIAREMKKVKQTFFISNKKI